jgi:hypothetical protein
MEPVDGRGSSIELREDRFHSMKPLPLATQIAEALGLPWRNLRIG